MSEDDYKPPKSVRLLIVVVVVALILIALALAWLTQPRWSRHPNSRAPGSVSAK
ncbi:MAG: hypothetical protein ACRD06_09425 [Terriglobia bacterium]